MKVKLLESHCIVDVAGRASNLKANLARGLPLLMEALPEREGSLAIVGSGPSVSDPDVYKRFLDWPGEVWAINGAYDYLLSVGVLPDGFFGIDPLPQLTEYLRNAQKETTFYMASTCDPEAIGVLDGFKVKLWHACGEDSSFFPKGHRLIYGGTTAVTRAPFLAHALGWRDITLFGVDSSYTETDQYCYEWGSYSTDIAEVTIPVHINGENFLSELGLLKQVAQLGTMLQNFNLVRKKMLKIHGAGLIGAYMRAPVLDDSTLELVPPDVPWPVEDAHAA